MATMNTNTANATVSFGKKTLPARNLVGLMDSLDWPEELEIRKNGELSIIIDMEKRRVFVSEDTFYIGFDNWAQLERWVQAYEDRELS